MHCGYLYKRNVPISPPSMQKVYSVLWGTFLLDYDTEEEAKTSMTPRLVSEILGVSEWDGQGRANQYPHSFLLVTHTGKNYYLSAPTLAERDEWILHVKRALECTFVNEDVFPFKPCKIIQDRPQPSQSNICHRTRNTITHMSSAIFCKSCGRVYSSSEYVSELSTVSQIGQEELEKVCSDCKASQMVIIWLKTLNYMHVSSLHELSPQVQRDLQKFKASFRFRRQQSQRLDMAAQLFEQKSINSEEFEELRRVDHDYRRELLYSERDRLKHAIDAIGDDMQTIISLLLNPSSTEKGGRHSYFMVLLRIMDIADKEPELLDFYWPQLVHVLILESSRRSQVSLVKVDLLQQCLLVISQRYPPLGLKLTWALVAAVNDYADKRLTQTQFGACMALLLQLDMAMTGMVSVIADVPTCMLMAKCLRPAQHQQQEIAFELSTLFLVRRRLQELYDEEEAERDTRNTAGRPGDDKEAVSSGSESATLSPVRGVGGDSSPDNSICGAAASPLNDSSASFALDRSHMRGLTCLQLLRRLGVGEATPLKARPSTIDDEEDAAEDGSEQGEGGLCWSGFGEQLDFISSITELVDSLRHIDRAQRTACLRRGLQLIDDVPGGLGLGWDPTASAGEPAYRITRIFVEDCRVFRTKARAPSLVVCEVEREEWVEDGSRKLSVSHIRTFSADDSEMRDVGSLVDGSISRAIHDINEHRRQEEGSENKPQAAGLEVLPALSRSQSYTASDSSDLSPKIRSAALRGSSTKASLLSANRKTITNFQNILVSANSSSHDDLQLLAGSMENIAAVGDATAAAAAAEGGPTSARPQGVAAPSERLYNAPFANPNPAEPITAPALGEDDVTAGRLTQRVYDSAKKLLDAGTIDQKEFNHLILSDCKFRVEVKKEEEVTSQSKVESAFGESWASKKDRLLGERLQGDEADGRERLKRHGSSYWPLRDLRCFIIKSNDDLRQEVCCLQLMNLCREIFIDFGLGAQLVLRPYKIISTSNSTGVVEVLADTMSIDGLKKMPGFTTLASYFRSTYGTSTETLSRAKRNFAASLAAYSLFSYILLVKDRHNGNMLIDTEGHIIHIDFGFLLSIAPGGSFSLETAPFKLTEEMVDVMGGLESHLFGEFVKAFTAGFLALRANAENIVSSVKVLSLSSSFPCFRDKDGAAIIDKLRARFRSDLSVKEAVQHCLDLIIASYGHLGTRQYDSYQYYTNGIQP